MEERRRAFLKYLDLPTNTTAAWEFGNLVVEKAEESGVSRVLVFFKGSTLTHTPERQKQCDASWIPRELPTGRAKHWPSVALEAGYSESQAKLRRDMEFWLNRSCNEVQMGITVDIKRPSGKIFFTTWRRGTPVPPRTAARGKNGEQETISGDENITVPFSAIMLRDRAEGETDFILTREELLEVAEKVWFAMD
ncbi:hypothetical protein AJ79_04886 [Helicocarpus griseus UAMH5409]|uniref:Uncharacterized protein n=1 Tax=Helicocarpus griseus UAMH5409 TaxID=1447875 RepID=A0A2B7XR21_9EURO|nr:hypothetical protein AJ79_04886 [Helicocarpus griseus UAMH5409]